MQNPRVNLSAINGEVVIARPNTQRVGEQREEEIKLILGQLEKLVGLDGLR
jgi:hypothetical protein